MFSLHPVLPSGPRPFRSLAVAVSVNVCVTELPTENQGSKPTPHPGVRTLPLKGHTALEGPSPVQPGRSPAGRGGWRSDCDLHTPAPWPDRPSPQGQTLPAAHFLVPRRARASALCPMLPPPLPPPFLLHRKSQGSAPPPAPSRFCSIYFCSSHSRESPSWGIPCSDGMPVVSLSTSANAASPLGPLHLQATDSPSTEGAVASVCLMSE